MAVGVPEAGLPPLIFTVYVPALSISIYQKSSPFAFIAPNESVWPPTIMSRVDAAMSILATSVDPLSVIVINFPVGADVDVR